MEISYHVSWEQDTNHECNSSTIEDGSLLDGSDNIDCLYSCSGTITRMSYMCTVLATVLKIIGPLEKIG